MTASSFAVRALGATFSLFALAGAAGAQCFEWSSGFGPAGAGLDATVRAFAIFDDGNGPALYAGGDFTQAGGNPAAHVARWDGTSWSALGQGVDGDVSALTVFDDGNGPALYAGGSFANAGGNAASSIAKWDGTSWSALGSGANDVVYVLHVFGSQLYAGGEFTSAGGTSAAHIASWNGSTWSALGSGTDAVVRSLAVYDDGLGGGAALCVGGGFVLAGGSFADHVARWNGSAWSTLGLGINRTAFALEIFDDGNGPGLYAGGSYSVADGSTIVNHIARWDGVAWSALTIGTNSVVYSLGLFDDGVAEGLYVGGNSTSAGGSGANFIARWNGSAWSALAGGLDTRVHAIRAFDDGSGSKLYVGGEFTNADGQPSSFIGRWAPCSNPGVSYCFGDDIDAAVTTNCPCLNFGAAGRGCGNSVNTDGALLTAAGTTVPDTLQLTASAIPTGVGSIYLQGSSNIAAGVVFGDGVRCAGGSLTRLGLKNDLDFDGVTTLGPASGDPEISATGGVVSGNTYFYQVYYRNPNPSWCPPATFNITQGYKITW